jgi:hypothetical protein
VVRAALPPPPAGGAELAAALRTAIIDGAPVTDGSGTSDGAHLNTWWHPLQPRGAGSALDFGTGSEPSFAIGAGSLSAAGQMCLGRAGQPNLTALPAAGGGLLMSLLAPLATAHEVLRLLKAQAKQASRDAKAAKAQSLLAPRQPQPQPQPQPPPPPAGESQQPSLSTQGPLSVAASSSLLSLAQQSRTDRLGSLQGEGSHGSLGRQGGAVVGRGVPSGHTAYSWHAPCQNHVPVPLPVPCGHTTFSWHSVAGDRGGGMKGETSQEQEEGISSAQTVEQSTAAALGEGARPGARPGAVVAEPAVRSG